MNKKIAIVGVNGKMGLWFANYFHKIGFEVKGFDTNNEIKEKFIIKANSLVGAILQTDYIKFARARGISETSIHYKHALKNGLIPVITIAGINIGTLIAFSIITETVFQWPGMGFLFIQAVKFVDIPIMSAYLVFIAFVFVLINFIVDILYYFIDPRIRVKSEAVSG